MSQAGVAATTVVVSAAPAAEDHTTEQKPARLAGRRERIALLAGFLIGSMSWNICWPFMPLRFQDIGVQDLGEVARLAGIISGTTNLITAGLGTFWSYLGERYGYKLQILRAHTGTIIGMGAIGLAGSLGQLIGATALLGTLGGNYPHYMALAASRTPASDIGRVVGDLQAAGQIGGTIGPIIGGLIASQYGVPPTFLVACLVTVLALFVIGFGVNGERPVVSVEPTRPRGSLREAFARPEQRALMLLLFMGDMGINGLRPLIPVVIASRESDPATIATITGITATVATAGTVIAALAIGRVSRRISPRTLLLTTMPIAAVLAAIAPLVPTLPLVIVHWAFMGLASGVVTPTIFAWLGRLAPSGGGGFALLASTNMLGFAVGPMIMGQASVFGLEWPFRVAAIITAIGAILVLVRSPRPLAIAAT